MIARKIHTVVPHVKLDNRILTSSQCSICSSNNVLQNVQRLSCNFVSSKDYLFYNKYISSVCTPAPMREYSIPNKQHVSAGYIRVPKNILHCGSGTVLTRTNLVKPHYISARQISDNSMNTFGTIGGMISETKAVALMQDYFLWIHSTTGLPWWATVIATTVALRTAVTLPLTIHQLHVIAKIEHMHAEMSKIEPAIVKEVECEIKQNKLTQKQAKFKYFRAIKEKKNEIIVRDNCHPAKVSILMLVQVPMWITLSFSLRNLAYMAPKYDENAIFTFLEIGEGGIGWIHNLTEVDPYYVLPVLLGVCNLTIIEAQVMLQKTPGNRLQKFIKYFLRGISIMMVPIAAQVPAILGLYWTTSSAYGLVQKFVLISPKVRRFVGIPQTPSEHQHPYKTLGIKIQERLGIKGKPEVSTVKK